MFADLLLVCALLTPSKVHRRVKKCLSGVYLMKAVARSQAFLKIIRRWRFFSFFNYSTGTRLGNGYLPAGCILFHYFSLSCYWKSKVRLDALCRFAIKLSIDVWCMIYLKPQCKLLETCHKLGMKHNSLAGSVYLVAGNLFSLTAARLRFARLCLRCFKYFYSFTWPNETLVELTCLFGLEKMFTGVSAVLL